MISLGLKRVDLLLKCLGNPQNAFKAIHVAGTNGKGSVCAYISSVLVSSKITTGRFNSPHLIHRWDCIQINGNSVAKELFLEVESYVKSVNDHHQLESTEFELLTATALEIFHRTNVCIAVVEVGLGGKEDATNILSEDQVLCTVITKIGLDHQGFLGDTLAEIAAHKGGIMKKGAPCIVDASNEPEVLAELKKIARDVDCPLILADSAKTMSSPLNGSYQKQNLGVALGAIDVVQKNHSSITKASIQEGISKTTWPGRLQLVQVGSHQILVDGAHNTQSAKLLREFVDSNMRKNCPITWVIGFSKPRTEFVKMLQEFGIKHSDKVVGTEFGPVEGMPWVKAADASEITANAMAFTQDVGLFGGDENRINIENLAELCRTSQVVVCGSLYLISELLKKLEEQE